MELYIGIMSGTSMDGIDSVLVCFDNGKIQTLATHSQTFPLNLKADLEQLIHTYQADIRKIGETDHILALCYADAVNQLISKAGMKASQLTAIGCHGQTVFHAPETKYPFTMQLGDGNLLAARTGIRTITDFRRMDMAFGGGGAPLVPAFHQVFMNAPHEKRCILNLGGIANITLLAEKEENVLGFDTGPANCLMDSWIQKAIGENYDCGGNWARSGKMINELLDSMLKDDYFSQKAPKSTGRELFNLTWLNHHLPPRGNYKDADVQTTLTELTALSIAQAILQSAPETNAVYACGGGVRNGYLLERIAFHLEGRKISTTDELGIPSQSVEATAFAWLAMRRMHGQYGNLPAVTGATQKVLLGTIYEPLTF